MLLLAGVDRLDKELAVGQMQGKFQMQVIGQVGHAVHEDAPDKVEPQAKYIFILYFISLALLIISGLDIHNYRNDRKIPHQCILYLIL